MAKTNATESDLLSYVLNNVAPSWAAAGTLYVALHSADPGEAGDQSTSEISYTGYARVAIDRSNVSADWSVSAGVATSLNQIQFGTCTAGTATALYMSIGTLSSGAGQILYRGSVPSLSISANITPQFAISAITISED